jgi:hypothetical protein
MHDVRSRNEFFRVFASALQYANALHMSVKDNFIVKACYWVKQTSNTWCRTRPLICKAAMMTTYVTGILNDVDGILIDR